MSSADRKSIESIYRRFSLSGNKREGMNCRVFLISEIQHLSSVWTPGDIR